MLSPSVEITQPARPVSPCWSYIICGVLLLIGFCSFAFTLDRYPLPYNDEAIFNYVAIQYLHHHGFIWRVAADAPHGDTIWAYHGPFFPRLQILTFTLLGISEFACRIPQYLAAHLAVGVICFHLLRRGLYRPALAVAGIWLGDRTFLEVQVGRADGVALFFLTLCFVAGTRLVQTGSRRWGIAAGAFLGFAAGFHPVALGFSLALVGMVFLLNTSWTRRRQDAAAVAVGFAIPAILIIWCWLPDIFASISQLLWHLRLATRFVNEPDNPLYLQPRLRWAHLWIIALCGTLFCYLLPSAYQTLRVRFNASRSPEPLSDRQVILFAAALFSLVGFAIITKAPGLLYYLIYFTMWPIIGFAMGLFAVEERQIVATERRSRVLEYIFGTLFLIAWLPSLAWNIQRFREMVKYQNQMGMTPIAHVIADHIPKDANVVGSPEIFLLETSPLLRFHPLPFIDNVLGAPDDAYVVLDEIDWKRARKTKERLEKIVRRPVVFDGPAFPKVKYLPYRMIILGPNPPTSTSAATIPSSP